MDTKGTTLEMALMGLLTQGPRSGYDLRKTFSSTAWRHYSDSPGSIYPALNRLQNRGWIEETGGSDDARRRQAFRPTRKGKAAFIQWLAQPLSRETIRFRQQELLLRFAFMDGSVDRSVVVKFLEEIIAELKAYLPEMKELGSRMRSDIEHAGHGALHTSLLAFESGIAGTETQLAWAQKTRSRLIYDSRK